MFFVFLNLFLTTTTSKALQSVKISDHIKIKCEKQISVKKIQNSTINISIKQERHNLSEAPQLEALIDPLRFQQDSYRRIHRLILPNPANCSVHTMNHSC